MRNLEDTLELRPSLCGTICAAGKTAIGAPIDTIGFGNVLAILVAGAASGTSANAATLSVKFQESASATGTGTDWADISNGEINGTLAFANQAFFIGTDQTLRMEKIFEKISDGTRKRYIRAHATLAGTDGAHVKYSVAVLLGACVDTTQYITNAVTFPTGNAQFTIGK